MLDASRSMSELRLAPRINRAYTFNAYVDNTFIGQYTTKKNPNVTLQTFQLPADTAGSTLCIESASHNWFKVHEVELYNSSIKANSCGSELSISNVTVPARDFRKNRLIDGDLSETSNWSNKDETWFDLTLANARAQLPSVSATCPTNIYFWMYMLMAILLLNTRRLVLAP